MHKNRLLPRLFSTLSACLLAACLLLTPHAPARADEAGSSGIILTVRLTRLHPKTVTALVEGDRLTDAAEKKEIGVIIDLAFTPHMMETYSTDKDALCRVPHPFYRDATLTIRANGTLSGSACKIGRYRLILGETLDFFTPSFRGSGECTAIYREENAP